MKCLRAWKISNGGEHNVHFLKINLNISLGIDVKLNIINKLVYMLYVKRKKEKRFQIDS